MTTYFKTTEATDFARGPLADKDLGLREDRSFSPRVLFVSSSKANGGADRHAVNLAIGLRARGATPFFACRRGQFIEGLCRDAGIETDSFRLRNSGDLGAVFRLARVIAARKIDIVHAHARRDFVPVALAVALAGVSMGRRPRLLFHMHLIRSLGEPGRLAGRFFQRFADGVVAVSDVVARYLTEEHGLRQGFVRRIFNGVDLGAYRSPETAEAQEWRAERRRQWGVSDDSPVIGVVGRLYRKGQIELLRAAPALFRRYPDARIVLVGPEELPGDHLRFQELIAHLGIGERVVVAGMNRNIPAAMAGLDILVHLPTDEAFGLVLVEAMASGVPVVATEIGGCREVVTDGETGLLVPPHEEEALIAALSALLDPAGGPDLRRRLGHAGRVSTARFSERQQFDALEALYTSLLENPAR